MSLAYRYYYALITLAHSYGQSLIFSYLCCVVRDHWLYRFMFHPFVMSWYVLSIPIGDYDMPHYMSDSDDIYRVVPNSPLTVSVSPIWQSQWITHDWTTEIVVAGLFVCWITCIHCCSSRPFLLSSRASCFVRCECLWYLVHADGLLVHTVWWIRAWYCLYAGSSLGDRESLVQDSYDRIYGTSFILHPSSSVISSYT